MCVHTAGSSSSFLKRLSFILPLQSKDLQSRQRWQQIWVGLWCPQKASQHGEGELLKSAIKEKGAGGCTSQNARLCCTITLKRCFLLQET